MSSATVFLCIIIPSLTLFFFSSKAYQNFNSHVIVYLKFSFSFLKGT